VYKNSIKNSQPFVKKMKNVMTPVRGFFWLTLHVYSPRDATELEFFHRYLLRKKRCYEILTIQSKRWLYIHRVQKSWFSVN